MHVVATAGHVDHGKSTLVHALTGTDPDRWPEEKARGLTIDLGFAHGSLPSGRTVAFIDVPGHVRFLKNMLAGVGAVDACLFVVDAGEGWMPQSEEHLRILELLGVRHGLVALTKVGVVDEETAELATLDVEDHTGDTFLDGAEIVAVDAPTGRGLDDLRAALDRLLEATPTAADVDRPRLWVDRSFAATGSGTVVTGTLVGGALAVGDELALVPDERAVRVRALQSDHSGEEALGPGRRAAVNLTGVSHHDVERGDALVRPGQWHLTRTVDATLSVLGSVEHDVSRRGAYFAYLGSGEHPVRLRVLRSAEIAPGQEGLVRLHLPRGLPLLPGDRYILRESGRQETVGGGELLDVAPVRPAATAEPDRSVDRVVAERGWVSVDELERLTGERREATVGRWVADPATVEATIEAVGDRIEQAGALGLELASLDEHERALLDRLGDVEVDGSRVRRAAGEHPLADHPFVRALEEAPFSPPAADGVDPDERRELVRHGLVVEERGVLFAPAAVEAAARVVAGLLAEHPEGVTVAQVRDALGTTRKHALPMLGILDGTGVTRRRDDLRIGGPRLPEV